MQSQTNILKTDPQKMFRDRVSYEGPHSQVWLRAASLQPAPPVRQHDIHLRNPACFRCVSPLRRQCGWDLYAQRAVSPVVKQRLRSEHMAAVSARFVSHPA